MKWLLCFLQFHDWVDGEFAHCDDQARHEVQACTRCRMIRITGMVEVNL
jgi:hypothetical protein